MKKLRFSESQIVSILNEVESRPKADEVYWKHGISSGTYYNWKSKYGGVGAPEFKRVKELEAENVKLERMYADVAIENDAIRDLLEKSLGLAEFKG
jgi:putative transposase